MPTRPFFNAVVMLQKVPESPRDLVREVRRDGIAHLNVLFRAAAVEEVVVRERLKAGYLPHRETAALTRIVMNEVVTILGDMTRDGGAWTFGDLHPVAVVEVSGVPVRVIRSE